MRKRHRKTPRLVWINPEAISGGLRRTLRKKVFGRQGAVRGVQEPANKSEGRSLLPPPDSGNRGLGNANEPTEIGVRDLHLGEVIIQGVHQPLLTSGVNQGQDVTYTRRHGQDQPDVESPTAMRKKAPPGSLLKQELDRPFISEWRRYRALNQEELASRVEERTGRSFTTATLSRIENAKQPYNQRQLEALAWALGCRPADLLIRDPLRPGAVWSIHDSLLRATPVVQEQIGRVVEAMVAEKIEEDPPILPKKRKKAG